MSTSHSAPKQGLTAEADWPARLAGEVERAAAQAGLSTDRATQPGFDGDALVWSWRAYVGEEAVASDIRLRAWHEDGSDRVHTNVTALVWPVDPKLRHKSLSLEPWNDDLDLSAIGLEQVDRPLLSRRLAKRPAAARRSAGLAAQALVGQLSDEHPEAVFRPDRSVEDGTNAVEIGSLVRRAATSLTDREIQVLRHYGRKQNAREVAAEMNVSEQTVHILLGSVRRKTLVPVSQLKTLASTLGLDES